MNSTVKIVETLDQPTKFPIQYINDDFLRRYTKSQDLSTVHHLCLTSTVIAPYKITFLDNLQSLSNLTVLNVSGNAIEKLEGLRSLTRLKCLNLNQNCVTRLDGLETLKNLQRLYLNYNMIQDIPPWFQHRLLSLKSLQIGHNQINNLHKFTKLRRLPNLTDLVIKGNPAVLLDDTPSGSVCSANSLTEDGPQDSVYKQCCRAFVIFHLRALTMLDGQIVATNERKEADSWFEQAEISRMNNQLESREAEVAELSNCLARLTIEAEDRGAAAEELARQKADQELKLEEMRRELEAKDELLRAKSNELLRACLKHYEIEQELAFYKIDNKLAGFLGKPPDPNVGGGSLSQLNGDVSRPTTDESPYLGKCRYIRVPGASFNFHKDATLPDTTPTHTNYSNTFPRPENNFNGHTDPRQARSSDFTSSLPRPNTLLPSPHSDPPDNKDATDSTTSSGDFSEHSEELKTISKTTPMTSSTPLKPYTSGLENETSSLAKSNCHNSVTMPYFGTSPEPEDFMDASPPSWSHGASVINVGSPCSSANQKSQPRSTVRIQCDSGIETPMTTGNLCGNESSLDDGRIESLPGSPRGEATCPDFMPQCKDSSTQVSICQTPQLNSSRCQTDSPTNDSTHRQWQERTKQRLTKTSAQQSTESIHAMAMFNAHDLKTMKKELARLQEAVRMSAAERNRLASETGSDEAARHKMSQDMEFASTASESISDQSQRGTQAKSRSAKPPTPRRQRPPHVSCSWNDGDQTEDSFVFDFARRPNCKVPTSRNHAFLRGASSAVDIRKPAHRVSTGCLRHRGKSMEVLSVNTPLDLQLLYNLQDELCDLHDRLQYSENANASRLEEAIRHISLLDNELRRRGRRDSPSDRLWQSQLAEGLEEMRRCRDSILDLQRKLTHEKPPLSQDRQGRKDDIEEMRSTINSQERELSKLTKIVTRLTNGGHGAPAVLETSAGGDVTDVARGVPTARLLCNVVEHHNLEDYVQHLQDTIDNLRQHLQQKRAAVKELKTSSTELRTHLKERDNELSRVNSELLASKEELLRANEKMKSLISERSMRGDALDRQKADSRRLESKIADLTNHLGVLRAEVAEVERQKDRRSEELAEISRRVDEKRSQAFSACPTDTDANLHSDSLRSVSPKLELDQLRPKIAEAKARMETLSREIGVRTAELELLNSKKSQEARLAQVQLENTQRELQQKLNELKAVKDELSLARQELERVASERHSTQQTGSLHQTSGTVPGMPTNPTDLAQQLQTLQGDIARRVDELSRLDSQKVAKKDELAQLEKLITEAKDELTLTRTRGQNAEAQLALNRQKCELLKGQLEAFEASVEVKQKLISDLCASSESRVSAMAAEIRRLLTSAEQLANERTTLKAELAQLKQQVQARTSELQGLEEEIKSSRQGLAKTAAANSRQASAGLNAKISRASDKLRALNEKISHQTAESEKLSQEITTKHRLVQEMDSRLSSARTNPSELDELNSRLEEMGNLLREREREIEDLIADKTKLISDHTQLASELTETRAQLDVAQRACRKLKRRTAKELADLERVAEEQCNRASLFAEELAVLRRNYTYLQARVRLLAVSPDVPRCWHLAYGGCC
uniref:Centriolin n=1 Tax=Mesocestoides corti TaxID=53468 RepID=A0A5K3EWE7_MESCO